MADERTDVIIIGGGVSGLSAGCYARMNGYRTRIFEMAEHAGGVCTSWQRHGYTVDGCIHYLLGAAPGTGFYRMWQEVGALAGRRMVFAEQLARIEGRAGQVLNVYTDLGRLEQHLLELAPEDGELIRWFIRTALDCTRYDLPVEKAFELFTAVDALRMANLLPFVMLVRKWGRVSLRSFAENFQNQFLREALPQVSGLADFPMMAFLTLLAWAHRGILGYPVGGSLAFSQAIEKRYLELGGAINYHAPVEKILVESDRAVGVRLADGSEHPSGLVISAADGHSTIFDMLEGRYLDEKVKGYYESLPLLHPVIHIALGMARTFPDVPALVTGLNFPLANTVDICGHERQRLTVNVYNFDPTLAPQGKTLVTVLIPTDYQYWKALAGEPERYRAEKERVVEQVIGLLEQRFPGISREIEMRDVATPVTFERYTGNWKGSFEGWDMSTRTFGMRMSKRLPDLGGFYMIGQWVEPGGGLPPAVMSARHAVQLICRQDKRRFVTTIVEDES